MAIAALVLDQAEHLSQEGFDVLREYYPEGRNPYPGTDQRGQVPSGREGVVLSSGPTRLKSGGSDQQLPATGGSAI